jgi:hypothetical protein
MKSFRILLAAAGATLALGAFAAPAMAITAGEAVSGTTATSLALTAGTGAVFATNFQPSATATQSGALTATDTNPSWTLQVQDNAATNPGKLQAAATGCTGSDAVLANALTVTVSSGLGGVVSAGSKTISGTAQTVASATSQLLAANVLTTAYSQVIPATEVMKSGCLYSLTSTYTLQ